MLFLAFARRRHLRRNYRKPCVSKHGNNVPHAPQLTRGDCKVRVVYFEESS